MSISDWSSDVCSSDLRIGEAVRGLVLGPVPMHVVADHEAGAGIFDRGRDHVGPVERPVIAQRRLIALQGSWRADRQIADVRDVSVQDEAEAVAAFAPELGRSSCRERGCQYV